MNITDERKESVDYSDGYYESGSALVVNKEDDSMLLHDEPDVLSVFIYASESFRIDNIMKKHHISAKEAKKLVRKERST